MSTILYFPLYHVEVWTGFVWLILGNLNMVWPSVIILCKEEFSILDFLCFSDFVCCSEVNLYKAAIISFYAT
jgi:hypothetical protein